MIVQTFEDAFCPAWIQTHLANPAHDLIILRHIIPWQPIMERLAPFYNPHKGRPGHSLRILVATSVLDSPIIYPTDVRLLYRTDGKMAAVAREGQIALWWDPTHVKQRWRAYT